MWIRVPGLPFNIPVPGEREERLPGMREWVPVNTIERVRRGRDSGASPEEVVAIERDQTNNKRIALGGGIGGASGGLLARSVAGEEGMAPFKEISEKGVTKKTLLGLKSLPLKMRLLPVAGAGAGALAAILQNKAEAPAREHSAREALRGLAIEDLHTQNELMNAVKSVHDLKDLKKEGMDDASATLLAAGVGGLGGYAAGAQMAKLMPIGGAAVGALLLAALVSSMRKNNRLEPEWRGYSVKSAASYAASKHGPAEDTGRPPAQGKVTMPAPGADGSKSQFKMPKVTAFAVAKLKPRGSADGGVVKEPAGKGSVSNG